MRISHLTALVLSMLVFACGEKDATAFDPAGQEWEFSMSNPLPIMENLLVPENTPISGRLRKEIFQPGEILWVEDDSILVKNDYKIWSVGVVKKYPLLLTEEVADSVAGFRLTSGIGTTLNVALYKGDSLMGEWLFEEKKTRFKEIAFGELDGQTFRCAFPGGDTMQVYFGTTYHTSGRDEGKAYEYFVDENPNFREEHSYSKPDRFRYWGAKMSSMRGNNMYFSMARKGFSSKRHVFGRNGDGMVIATYFEVKNERYERVEMPLVLQSPIRSDFSEVDFADRINSGTVLADDTYPSIDSARVSYAYQKDYKGIEYDELAELEFSAEPGGEFIVVVRDRLLWNRKWKLSPDGHYLITLGKRGDPAGHYPILAYTEDHIDLRMPFTVKTREPRGVALESYAEIDVFIRITRRTDATSR